MLIVCPSCASEYALDPDRIGDGGRKVRCAVCRETWLVRKPAASDAETSPAGRLPQTIDGVASGALPPNDRPKLPVRAPRRAVRSQSRTGRALAVAMILTVLIAPPAAIGLRQQVVRQLPPTATLFAAIGLPVNLIGLELAGVRAAVEQEGSARVLVIEGEVRSTSAGPVLLPRLDLAIEDQGGADLYRWSAKPPVPQLGPGESARFTARLASPPPDGARLVASFQVGSGDQSVALR
jgi:predicted Zn finger-like uncharacterized protein